MSDEFPPLAALPNLTLHPSLNPEHIDAIKIVNDWLLSLTKSLAKGQPSDIRGLFLENVSWWRDFVSFAWDIACLNGTEAIFKHLSSSETGFAEPKADQTGALQPQLADMGGLRFIQSGFSFKNNFGSGRGVLRLANVGPDDWKAWTVFTLIERLNDGEGLQSGRTSPPQTDSGLQVLVVGAGKLVMTNTFV